MVIASGSVIVEDMPEDTHAAGQEADELFRTPDNVISSSMEVRPWIARDLIQPACIAEIRNQRPSVGLLSSRAGTSDEMHR